MEFDPTFGALSAWSLPSNFVPGQAILPPTDFFSSSPLPFGGLTGSIDPTATTAAASVSLTGISPGDLFGVRSGATAFPTSFGPEDDFLSGSIASSSSPSAVSSLAASTSSLFPSGSHRSASRPSTPEVEEDDEVDSETDLTTPRDGSASFDRDYAPRPAKRLRSSAVAAAAALATVVDEEDEHDEEEEAAKKSAGPQTGGKKKRRPRKMTEVRCLPFPCLLLWPRPDFALIGWTETPGTEPVGPEEPPRQKGGPVLRVPRQGRGARQGERRAPDAHQRVRPLSYLASSLHPGPLTRWTPSSLRDENAALRGFSQITSSGLDPPPRVLNGRRQSATTLLRALDSRAALASFDTDFTATSGEATEGTDSDVGASVGSPF